MRFLLGLVLGLIMVPVCVFLYIKYGHPPVAVADPPFPMEKKIVHMPLNARIDHEMPKPPPLAADAATFEAGAQIYREQCSACHGLKNHPSVFADNMYPHAPQLWKAHATGGVVGVSDDPAGETYWKVANGIRLTGMPAYNKILSDTQIWQVSLLLANADKPLSPAAEQLVSTPLSWSLPATAPTAPQGPAAVPAPVL